MLRAGLFDLAREQENPPSNITYEQNFDKARRSKIFHQFLFVTL